MYRLYTLEQHKDMQQYQQAEILRVDLQHALLQLKSLGVDDVVNFDYIQKPEREKVVAALRVLYVLKAIGKDHKITPLGQTMVKYPLMPVYSKALLLSLMLGGSTDMTLLVALLSSEGLWAKESKTGDTTRRDIKHPGGDHETIVRAYRRWVRRGRKADYARQKGYNQRALL